MRKNYSENLQSIKNTGNNLTLKQMFDMYEKLIVEESDESFGVSQISWEDSPRKQLSLVSDRKVISLSHAKVYNFFRFCVMSWKDESEFNMWGTKDNEQECIANATFVSVFCTKILSRTLVILRTWIRKEVVFYLSTYIDRPQGEWDRVGESMMIRFGEGGHPVFRATSLVSRGTLKSKGGGQLSIHFCADEGTIETVFRTKNSVNQLSIYGAVSDLCDVFIACQARTGRPVLAGQSDPFFEPARLLMKTPTPPTEDPAQEDLLQTYQERVARLSQQNRVIKFCTEAGFLTTVDVGQYFMTKTN